MTAVVSPSAVKSPCTNVCKIHQPTGWCEGCARSIPEIKAWSKSDDVARLQIMGRLPPRREQLLALGICSAAEPTHEP
ncbi:DUF1289 domain-containing protein [Roseateles sp.]|uniref:DUF1289 domain-containing protein n=1 Tax=Roseateles sp. TaxID=1971397 RepID=UPI00286A35DA|nr:DUF1289 domain-containing protein [Roseateles sp.]